VIGRYAEPRTKLPEQLWTAVYDSAKAQGLRATAREYGVSPEAVRQVMKKIEAMAA
jgi:hypothetical protein